MRIESSAFRSHMPIPRRHTCDGEDIAPPLAFQIDDVPSARSLAVVVDDPDAPAGPWVHAVLYNLDPSTPLLREGWSTTALPPGARLGTNSWQRVGWGGPCPPRGTHRYVFTLYALDVRLPELGHATKSQLLQAMAGHVLAVSDLVGTYASAAPRRAPERRSDSE
jgi:hypothetical protein